MKKMTVLLVFLAAICLGTPAIAVPVLQLDIEGGSYDWLSESVLISSGDFTLYALLTPGPHDGSLIGDDYYLSIAVAPRLDTASDFGSFTIDGNPISVTGDMTHGNPPLETFLSDFDGGDLGPHGIYPTYFYEYAFTFDPSMTTATYNTQDMPGGTEGGLDPSGGGTYYIPFQIAGANFGQYGLHFDLYNKKLLEGGDVDRDLFAPFSHDAQSVPEPSSLLLLGIGMIGLVGIRKRLRQV